MHVRVLASDKRVGSLREANSGLGIGDQPVAFVNALLHAREVQTTSSWFEELRRDSGPSGQQYTASSGDLEVAHDDAVELAIYLVLRPKDVQGNC
jgi:hypothetical protein